MTPMGSCLRETPPPSWVLGEAGGLLWATQLLCRCWGSVCSNCPISSLVRGPAASGRGGTGHLSLAGLHGGGKSPSDVWGDWREGGRASWSGGKAGAMRPPPPCQVQGPQKHHQLQRQVGHEERVVALAHTVLHPGAVVVIAADTAAALTAVPSPQGLLWAQRELGLNTGSPLGPAMRAGGQGWHLGGLPGGGGNQA